MLRYPSGPLGAGVNYIIPHPGIRNYLAGHAHNDGVAGNVFGNHTIGTDRNSIVYANVPKIFAPGRINTLSPIIGVPYR